MSILVSVFAFVIAAVVGSFATAMVLSFPYRKLMFQIFRYVGAFFEAILQTLLNINLPIQEFIGVIEAGQLIISVVSVLLALVLAALSGAWLGGVVIGGVVTLVAASALKFLCGMFGSDEGSSGDR